MSAHPDKFMNYYICPSCSKEWKDIWSSAPDMDCPVCFERHISPHRTIGIIEKPDNFVQLIGDQIIADYRQSDVCIGEYLAYTTMDQLSNILECITEPAMTLEDLYDIYVYCKIKVEGDIFYAHQDGNLYQLKVSDKGIERVNTAEIAR